MSQDSLAGASKCWIRSALRYNPPKVSLKAVLEHPHKDPHRLGIPHLHVLLPLQSTIFMGAGKMKLELLWRAHRTGSLTMVSAWTYPKLSTGPPVPQPDRIGKAEDS